MMSSCHMLRLRRLSLGFVCAASLNPTYTYGRQGSPSPVSATTDICIMIIMIRIDDTSMHDCERV